MLGPGLERTRATLLALWKGGVTIASGTDAGLPPYGPSLHNELEQLMLAGHVQSDSNTWV